MKPIIHRLGRETAYLLATFPVAVIAFTLVMGGVSLGMLTLVIGVGVVVFVGVHWVARGFAATCLISMRAILGQETPDPSHSRPPQAASPLRRLLHPLFDRQSWLNLLWCVINFPLSLVTAFLTIVSWCVALSLLAFPLYGWILNRSPNSNPTIPALWLGLGDSIAITTALYFVVGLLFAVALPWLIHAMAILQSGLSRVLLTSFGTMQERLETLTESRAAATSAEAIALRRLERDIHDGPQQRLVYLGMELSRLKRNLKQDPDNADKALDKAIIETRDTLNELRALSQGIAPPVLTDRGLNAALSALASRSTVPVDIELDPAERYEAPIENAVYFVAAEALTNISKHSQALQASLVLTRTNAGKLQVCVGDNGIGGAHVRKGHGLQGLTDRVRAVDGSLTISSPEGGPTFIVAQIPCE
ncbi:sensor histidine kinase [Natronoglycomyces albus]|uniref:histidine kinase n=1 Tax=Natronoglycomyces albus TaxID=2811108 RepID=A0A895XHU6_9ACTN|nr:sensor domain-containing protein [Natronoglycomyces albus]QSB05401.1 sensor domain-containing protein [Natronoglycomyces albus]